MRLCYGEGVILRANNNGSLLILQREKHIIDTGEQDV